MPQQHQRSSTSTFLCKKLCCCIPESIVRAPRELWLVLLLKLLGSLAYFSASLVFVPFLHNEFHYTDVQAGTLYGVWGLLASVFGVVCGPLIDYFGVKKSLVLGSLLGVAGGVILALARTRGWLLLSVCFLMPMSTSLGIPVLTIGVKRFTHAANKDLAYGIFYSTMNIGAVVAGPCVDAVRFAVADGISYGAYTASAARVIFLMAGMLMLLMALLAVGLMRPIVVMKDGRVLECGAMSGASVRPVTAYDDNSDTENDEDILGLLEENAEELHPSHAAPVRCSFNPRSWLAPLRDRFFWRLVIFSFSMTPVNMIFRHLDATLPTWLLRTMGERVAFGTLYIVDPLCVIFLATLFPILFGKYDVYKRMIVGTAISALSVFVLVIQSSELSVIMFGVLLSVGESLYSPLINSYTMSLAPKDKEGSYSALSSAPLFTTKLFVGFISGALLGSYCPDGGPTTQCAIVWVWVGSIAMLSPVFLLAAKRIVHDSQSQIRISQQVDGKKREDPGEGILDKIDNTLEKIHENREKPINKQ